MANKIKFKVNVSKFSEFVERLDDLTKIDDTIKVKIDNDNILIYSMLSSGQTMLAFKNYLLNTKDYLEYEDSEYSYDLIIANAKKFVKNLEFLQSNEKITFEISYKQNHDDDTIMDARAIQLVGGKLKINLIAGEHYEIRDMNKKSLSKGLDLKNKKWVFLNHKNKEDREVNIPDDLIKDIIFIKDLHGGDYILPYPTKLDEYAKANYLIKIFKQYWKDHFNIPNFTFQISRKSLISQKMPSSTTKQKKALSKASGHSFKTQQMTYNPYNQT